MTDIFDLIILGLGPAGLRAAEIAAENNLKVLAFEKNNIGGCCLNKGCVPTKAILHSAKTYKEIKNSKKSGILIEGEIFPDIKNIIENKNTIIQKLSKAKELDLIKKGVEIIKEEGVPDFKNLTVNGKKCKNLLVATGSTSFELPNLPFDHKDVLSSDDILEMMELPKSIAIIGTGAIGVEWARIFSDFGVQTTVIEKMPNILPAFDIDIQKRAERILKQNKVKIIKGQGAISFKDRVLTLEDNTKIEAEKILVAVGRKRNAIEGLTINPDLTTNFEHVYIAGDICSKKMLAHTASMQASSVMGKILNKETPQELDVNIPSVIYGEPEFASIGLNEQEAPEGCKIYNIPISYLAKSWCDNSIDGFIKIITQGEFIIGAHIVSSEASSLITQIQLIMKNKMPVCEVKNLVFAHPTYSEGIYEAICNG